MEARVVKIDLYKKREPDAIMRQFLFVSSNIFTKISQGVVMFAFLIQGYLDKCKLFLCPGLFDVNLTQARVI